MAIDTQRNVAVLTGAGADRPVASSIPEIGTIFSPTGVAEIDILERVNGVNVWKAAAANYGWYDVTAYGANPDGLSAHSTANRVAIQAAIDAIPSTGGILWFPNGIYRIDAEIVLKSFVHMMGSNANAVQLRQITTTANCVRIPDGLHVIIENMTIVGPSSGSGIGIYFQEVSRTANFITLRNLEVNRFGSDGVRIDAAIVSLIEKVTSLNHGGHGFNCLDGTSIVFSTTWPVACAQAGYHLDSVNYATFLGTAVDTCGVGYWINDCRSIAMNSCGSEDLHNNNSTYNGTALRISATDSMVINGFRNYTNNNVMALVTGNSTGIIFNSPQEEGPASGATRSIQVDAGCQVSVGYPDLLTASSYAPGTTNFPNSAQTVVKAADQTVNNSATLVNDSELVASVVKNATYLVNVTAIYDSNTTADIKFAFNGPSGATMQWTTNGLTTAAAGSSGSITVANAVIGDGAALGVGGAGSGTLVVANLRGVATIGSTAGSIQLRWAQNTADASDTIVKAKSWIEVRRIG